MKSARVLGAIALFTLGLGTLSGCAQIMGRLRPDLDDSYANEDRPTRGGLLADYGDGEDTGPLTGATMGGRSPASASGAWVNRMNRASALAEPSRNPAGKSLETGSTEGSWDGSSDDSGEGARQPAPVARRATRGDFVDGAEDAGSLWSTGGQTNFFFSKNRTRTSGDLITITIEADMLRDLASEVKRSLRPDEREQEIALLEKSASPKAAAAAGGDAQADAKAGAKTDEVKKSSAAPDPDGKYSFSQVDLQNAIGVKAGDTFLAEVVERFPNGNYKIRGTKRLPYRGGSRLMTLVGVVRGNDLSDDDKVTSGKLYEYRLEAVR